MFRISIRVIGVAAALTLGGLVARAVDPYQSRLDREYKSYSQALSRAYSTPPPRPPPSRSYSSPSYSSSSSSRSSSPNTPSRSYSSPTNYATSGQAQQRFTEDRRTWEQKYSQTPQQRASTAAERAAWERSRQAEQRAAQERLRNESSYSRGDWEVVRKETAGKAPLVAPPRRAMESPREEFLYYEGQALLHGSKALWERLRLGQMCLVYQGPNATPARAFGFFSASNPDWPEVQLGLGVCYMRGYGVSPDAAKAREWLEKAAAFDESKQRDNGFLGRGDFQRIAFEACRELAVAYDLGQVLPQNADLAAQWYDRAQNRPLFDKDRADLKALKIEFWKRHARSARAMLERRFAALQKGEPAPVSASFIEDVIAAGDASTIYELGEFTDTRDWRGSEIATGRSGISYFLAAAKLGHEAAARAFFSPAKNGYYNEDLDGDPFWKTHADFVREQWPLWEKKFLAAAQAGDAAANIPLAFHYSGARGNPVDRAAALRHGALLPASMPPRQRQAIERAIASTDEAQLAARDSRRWLQSVLAKFRRADGTVILPGTVAAADTARVAALRDEGNALARTAGDQARAKWFEAAALGDLPAQVQLFVYAKRQRLDLGGAYEQALQARLETAAQAGDPGAVATLAALLDGHDGNSRRLRSANNNLSRKWRDATLTLAPQKAQFLKIARDPKVSDADFAAARAAALRETEQWKAHLQKWDFEGQPIQSDVMLSAEDLSATDTQRVEFVALASTAARLETQLAIWEKTVEPTAYDPEADARFHAAYEAWQGLDEAERDLGLALDCFAQSAGLGHPLAPLALAYFHASGFGGFPKNADLSRRFRALAEARLTALAETNNLWAQTYLGYLLVTGDNARDDALERPDRFEWLPQDKARGMKWLHTAAIEGAMCTPNLDDASGQPVAWYVVQMYYSWGLKAEKTKWELIRDLVEPLLTAEETTAAQWEKAQTKARALLAETPEAERIRVALDQAVEATTGDELAAALARVARARARLAAGFERSALIDATKAAELAPHRAEGWESLSQIQRSQGDPLAAAVSSGLARVLEAGPAAIGEFERAFAAFAKARPDSPSDIRDLLDPRSLRMRLNYAQAAHPQSVALNLLKERVGKILSDE
ncbi:hypothetical protein [Horticoccus sp. 23ND18S-11]|uniref:hypothetical protein n=1 Tax=Horticoccus sp. 23ND18S-11 TaxID=3391832 RepID=UPI0039C91496